MTQYQVRRPLHQKRNHRRELVSVLMLPLSMLFVEIATRLYLFGFVADLGWLYQPLLALTGGTLLSFVSLFMPDRARRIFTAVVLAVVGVYFSFHLVYYGIFHSLFSFQMLGLAGDAITNFWKQTLTGIALHLHQILTMFLPLILWLTLVRRFEAPAAGDVPHFFAGLIGGALAVITLLSIVLVPDSRAVIRQMQSDIEKTYRYYGVGFSGVVDIGHCIVGPTTEIVDNPYDQSDPDSSEPVPEQPKPVEYNRLDIDFDALIESAPNNTIREMHRYFASVPATEKNEYTGMFAGKNLIFLTLEGFSDKAISPTLTPTLYQMATEGFRFTNFYDTPWGGSTATGEYANMTGNFFSTSDCLKKSGSTQQYSAMGNLFKNAGYATFAYHNNTYTYYSRNLSHPNFGYTYKGIGNGLTVPFNGWPRSDKEMGEATVDDYLHSTVPFHAYYMTVSGHANYTWMGNSMCNRHRDDLPSDMTYSENVKAYIACQLEVEEMLASLVERLRGANKLKDTVFAMCCDHYPYALTDSELAELYGLDAKDIRSNYELYRNGFILWSPSMNEPVTVDTPCSSYDIVPTLANLFGIDYDSRLITGKDILSNTENICIINTLSSGGSWNWITPQGRYSTVTGVFTPSADCTLTTQEEINAYVSSTKKKVAAMRSYSLAILNNNYYKYVFDANGNPLKSKGQ